MADSGLKFVGKAVNLGVEKITIASTGRIAYGVATKELALAGSAIVIAGTKKKSNA